MESELTVRTTDGPRVIQLLCRRRRAAADRGEFFASIVDVTERRAVERERAKVAGEHAALAARLIAVQDESGNGSPETFMTTSASSTPRSA